MVENQPDAEDIVQETYMKLWQKRNDTEHIENIESFAVAVLKNACFDFLRKMKPETVELSALSQKISFLETQIEDKEKLQYVETIVKQLPERQQQLIRLRHYEELSDKEIEKLTGLKTGNIKVIISRARKTIKERLFKLYKYEI
jgi:RNA polymerase sigma-70 factor (ECF subfamily)